MKVLIIGAGLIGAAAAFRLGQAGAEVTVLEAVKPAAGASGRSFGWINANFFANPAHHRLRVAAMAAHQRLQADLPESAPNWQGTLWWEEEGAGFEAMQTELRDLGYPVEALSSAELAAAEPALLKLPSRALRFPTEGAVEAAPLTRALLLASGAKLLSGIAAKSLLTQGGRVTGARSPIGPFTADHTILAAGVATPTLLHSIGLDLPMLTRPGLLLRTKPVALRVAHILVTPEQEIRQTPDGSLLAPCAANHQADSAETIPDASAARAATLANLRGFFGEVTEAETLLGHRPVPGDTLPVLGAAAEGLSIAVMHSGVTLAALAAEALCAEITGQGADRLWSAYHPNRLLCPAAPA
jgi:D-hydroxyproline dehydrogenase subunit beta